MDLERMYRDAVGVGPAFREATASRLPGLHNGPGDAYRHIIGAAEMTRRHGAAMALTALNAHEMGQGTGQSDDERDRHPQYGAPSFSGRPVGSWNEDDVRAVMASNAYRQAGHPTQAETHARVRAWFERAYGNRPVRRDATGRQIDGPSRQPRIDAAGAAGGPVHVRAHSREGGRVDVDAHDRRPPAR